MGQDRRQPSSAPLSASYYVTGRDRPRRVRALFDRIAPRYDLINDLQSFGLHRRWKRRMIAEASPRAGDRVLDVCCGTGDLALRIAQPNCQVIGMDFSSRMLEEAARRSGAKDRSVCFCCTDALQLPVRDASFDIALIGYGLRNLADFDAGLAELWRILKPGGRLLILDFAWPRNAVWRSCYVLYLRWAVPVLGRVFCGDAAAYAYILDSLNHYPNQEEICRRLEKLGSKETCLHEWLGGIMSLHRAHKPG